MIRDDVVTLLAQRLNNRTDLNEKIVSEMILAQSVNLEQNGKFQPWFLITEYATELAEVGENRIPQPTDFLAEVEENGIQVQDTAGVWRFLAKGSEDTLTVKWAGAAAGLPRDYAFIGEHFTLFPTPDVNYPIRMRYAASQPSPTTNIENAWLKYAPDLVIAEVGEKVASLHMQNPTLAGEFKVAKAEAWARLKLAHEARIHANRNYTMGEEEE